MRVLLIESDPEELLFLRDVLLEIGEGRYWSNWVNLEVLDAATWTEASAILSHEPVDIVLLDPEVKDMFRSVQSAAPDIPIILLVAASGQSLGVRLVRDGAQDFLVKKQLDCAPLAHAIENAIERHRLLAATRATSNRDPLTSLLNRTGFLTSADRDRKIAERLGRRLMIMVAEISAVYEEQRRDLALIEAADYLRSLIGPADLLARIESARFGISIFDTDFESVEEAWARIHSALLKHRIQVGAAVFSNDRPATLEALLHQAIADLAPQTRAMQT